MVDEVYNKLNDQVWEIPTSSEYVSDSDSPLSLISTSMPSPTLAPSNAIELSSMAPLFNDQQEKITLSYPPRSSNGSSHYSKSFESSATFTTTSTSTIGITTSKALNSDNNQEIGGYGSVMCHENMIALNDSIACIKPQSVSIKWLTSGTDGDSSNNATTTVINDNNINNIGKEEDDHFQSSSDSTLNESSQGTSIETTSSTSASIKIVFSNNGGEANVNGLDVEHSFDQEHESSQGDKNEDDIISFTDIICDNNYVTDNEPNLTETDTSKEESDALGTPPPADISKKRKRKYTPKYKSNFSTSITTTVTSSAASSPSTPTDKKRRLTAYVRSHSSNSSNEPSPIRSGMSKSPEKKKRTVTSYDSQTSQYLKSVFFEVYSKQSKLTKEQRSAVQERTGLPSRNITYWFSNHKRRFQNTLEIYRKAVTDSEGSIKCYDDFVEWSKEQKLLEQED